MGEVIREDYLRELWRFKDQEVIKILTGVRRCGKSTILKQFRVRLTDSGVPEEDVLYINMESLSNNRFTDGMVLYNHIIGLYNGRKLYIMLDEVQMIDGWEKVVNSLMGDVECDLYLTGSNAYMLSTEISTLLTGRNIQIDVLPLSFKEFLELNPAKDAMGLHRCFSRFVHLGGMPFVRPDMDEETVLQRLDGIKTDIMLKDIFNRREKIDSVKVRKLIDYMFSEIGNSISADNV